MRSEILFLLPFSISLCVAQQQPAPPPPPPQHETIVVTGTFEPLSLDEMDRAITLLPARSMYLVSNTLTDLLRLDPSLDLQERSPDGVQTDLSIRGGSFGQTLVLLNGLRLNDAQTGHHDMDIPVPLEAVTQVEVLRGSGSSMYGSDATAGVVNIITAPPEGLELRLRTAVGNQGINQQRVSLADTFGKLSGQLTFSRDFSSGFMPDRDYRNLQFASTTHLLTRWGSTNLTLAYMDHPFGADQFYGPYPSWENTKTWWAGAQQALGKKTAVSFAYRRHSDLFVLFREDPAIYTNHHHDESYQAAVRRTETLGAAIHIDYGVEALHESIVSNNLGTHARSRAAAYGAVDFRALKRFSLSLSGREEVYRNFSGTFSPTVAGGVWISPALKFRASASRAFRIPTYTDLYYSDPANLGNPHLLPEHAWTYESGLDWSPAARVRAAVTVFERRERNGIDYYRSSADGLWQALNIDNLNFTGVESSLRVTPARAQTLDFRYTWLLGVQDTIPIGFTKYTFNYPVDSGVAAWQGDFGGVLCRTRIGVLNRRARDPYALWDVYAGLSRGKLHPFLQISNITAESYQEIQGVQMPGRTVIGGVEWVLAKH
ncbi:TonB-dependent receptor [Candidatus Sulfopaludibacter sp. SbA3]|nr:TonB-dependent receptor [Candidatus Sulfopaludibacter sp. SbA3]